MNQHKDTNRVGLRSFAAVCLVVTALPACDAENGSETLDAIDNNQVDSEISVQGEPAVDAEPTRALDPLKSGFWVAAALYGWDYWRFAPVEIISAPDSLKPVNGIYTIKGDLDPEDRDDILSMNIAPSCQFTAYNEPGQGGESHSFNQIGGLTQMLVPSRLDLPIQSYKLECTKNADARAVLFEDEDKQGSYLHVWESRSQEFEVPSTWTANRVNSIAVNNTDFPGLPLTLMDDDAVPLVTIDGDMSNVPDEFDVEEVYIFIGDPESYECSPANTCFTTAGCYLPDELHMGGITSMGECADLVGARSYCTSIRKCVDPYTGVGQRTDQPQTGH